MRRSGQFSSLEESIATYLRAESKRLLARTVTIKKADLDLFREFFTKQGHQDDLEGWTAEVSESFRKFLRKRRPGSFPRPEKFFYLATRPRHLDYSPATINRILSTVRHFAKWLDERGAFPIGNPMEQIRGEPIARRQRKWRGLRHEHLRWLKAACHDRLTTCWRVDQCPEMEGVIFHLLIETGLREAELVALDLENVAPKGLRKVVRRGEVWTFPLTRDARWWLREYLKVRGKAPGPLLIARTGHRLKPLDVHRACKRIADEVFKTRPQWRRFDASPRVLRYTYLTRILREHGREAAHRAAGTTWRGNVESLRERQPFWSDEERELRINRQPW